MTWNLAGGPRNFLVSSARPALDRSFVSYFAERPVPPSLASKAEGKGPGDGEEGPEGGEPSEGEEKPAEGGEKPAGETPAEGEKPAEEKPEGAEAKPLGPEVVKKSPATQLVVVGNAVFISDLALGGSGERAEVTASLALNLVNWLSGSPELIALRAKRYTNRALKDQKLQDEIKAWSEQVEAGEMEEATFRTRIDEARERQKDREKRERWINVIVPVFVIWLCGAVIWILRAASRGGKAKLPPPEPPQSLAEGGTDS
jgi:hypothetical protein